MNKTNPESMGAIPKDVTKIHTNNLPNHQNHDHMHLKSLEQRCHSLRPDSSNMQSSMSSSFQSSYDFKIQDHSPHKVKTKGKAGKPFCEFCKNNNEEKSVYMSHVLKDLEGRVVCPVRLMPLLIDLCVHIQNTFYYYPSMNKLFKSIQCTKDQPLLLRLLLTFVIYFSGTL